MGVCMYGNEDNQDGDIASLFKQPELSATAKKLRDDFVEQYFVDFNPILAATRVGFLPSFASEYAKQFMEEPYVARKIAEGYKAHNEVENENEQEEEDKRIIRRRLMQEASYHGPGSSHSARVSAWSRLAQMYGMDKPQQHKHDVNHRGGVMMVPGIANFDEWEAEAVKTQQELAHDTRH